ncbi:MAG TPA: PEP-utilizing enzyme [Ktedonosporobacter sp.]|nr:PEP-utilizing enzyme [Ktedonosporobacter sp.]
MDALASGLGASSGHHIGRIRLIAHPHELDQLQTGEVLVVRRSNPAWTVGMLKAGALISESGGIISHTAIVAREMGVPCIVGVQNATSLLVTGMRVDVDAEQGKIYRLEE